MANNAYFSIRKSLRRFIAAEASSSVALAFAAAVALWLANSSFARIYFDILEAKVLSLSVHHWINDGLMTIFFFLIGMEIKKEMRVGELSSLKRASLPILAAIGGMVFPSAIYLLLNAHGDFPHGWAIPMATDIAFALGVLGLFGKKIPLSLKVFLLALAIVDDLGAVLVIATFYTEEIRWLGLLLAAAGVAAIGWARALRLKSDFVYLSIGAVIWLGVLYSGVHATIAGVLIGFLTPLQFPIAPHSSETYSPLNDWIQKLHPFVSFGIMPVFALANAGIPLAGVEASQFFTDTVSMGVFLGLLLGKPFGILLTIGAARLLGLVSVPRDLGWGRLAAASSLAGIGFTMAIFITNLSLSEDQAVSAKIAIMAASLASATVGAIFLGCSLKFGKASE